MSQFPAISSVANIHPDDTTGEKPPSTDSDRDGIPDVHENLFEEWLNWTSSDNREVSVQGMDKDNASDAMSDFDIDGLNATEEYCWPYPANCTEPGFARGLTGIIDVNSGERLYLDPRMADTDGDGMPDGYEAWMCQSLNYFNEDTFTYDCLEFNPLNASDATLDYDEDGFDLDRDGFISESEKLTGPEEYWYGAPSNWTTELDGLRCHYSPPDATEIAYWPFLPSGDFTGLYNLLDACTSNETYAFAGDIWLGTNPISDDSDMYFYDSITRSKILLYPSSGDGIPDGWEIHFGLNPHNQSDNLVDLDLDGWDANRDGFISDDVSRNPEQLALGESLSSVEEYNVFLDDPNGDKTGTPVKAGLRSVTLQASDGTLASYPLTAELAYTSSDQSVIHHDTRALHAEDDLMWIGTKLGVTLFDNQNQESFDFLLPQGHDLNEMVMVGEGDSRSLVMLTAGGIWVAEILSDGELASSEEWDYLEGNYSTGTRLIRDDGSAHILGLGTDGFGKVIEVDPSSSISNVWDIGEPLSDFIDDANVTPTSVVHVEPASGTQSLYIGCEFGLISLDTPTGRDSAEPYWVFFGTGDASDGSINLDRVREIDLDDGVISTPDLPTEVRDIVADGPSGGVDQIIWVGTRSGLHKIDLMSAEISHSGSLEHPGLDGKVIPQANNIYSIYTTPANVILGSNWGMWSLVGTYSTIYGMSNQEWIPGRVGALTVAEVNGEDTIFAAISPGRFSNLELMDPLSNDSDEDGMLDGWEVKYGLDPTNPWDGLQDTDGDGVNLDDDPILERNWTNLDEYRYKATTENGFDTTDPNNVDTDGDGVNDGAEYFGYYFDESLLWCHYDLNMQYICDSEKGAAANATYRNTAGIDRPLDATNRDTDGDGMPDGWELKHRRWVGQDFVGGSNWTLDPLRPDDKDWDPDNDGLSNLCEYQWTSIKETAIAGGYFDTHGESPEAAELWSDGDPNSQDSDGDGLPDGWESSNKCVWLQDRQGINPLNNSDALSNPDGDGYDINGDGVLTQNEAFVNWLEYFIQNNSFQDLSTLPEGFTTDLFSNLGNTLPVPDGMKFIDRAGDSYISTQIEIERGSTNPLSKDSDNDGLPDGWEIWHSRWTGDNWSLSPIDPDDAFMDPDEDGLLNWEEYNSIDGNFSETNANRTTPQYFVYYAPLNGVYTPRLWDQGIGRPSFGYFIDESVRLQSGLTCDPNNPDTDGDGIIDGIELMFTQWDDNLQTWTLNPLVSGDGQYDGDGDGLLDIQELSAGDQLPANGNTYVDGTPVFLGSGDLYETLNIVRVASIIENKSDRGYRWIPDFTDWTDNGVKSDLMSFLEKITDPTLVDTDGDGMSDGFEYWFADYDNNILSSWTMNPLYNLSFIFETLNPGVSPTPIGRNADSDLDSWDCNQDGAISEDEIFTNFEEYRAREFGKYEQRFSPPSLTGFGTDAAEAYAEANNVEIGAAYAAIEQQYRGLDGMAAKIDAMNVAYSQTFNNSLLGISSPIHQDTDGDSLPDGWEYCYAVYGEVSQNSNHWFTNPVNPLDASYDGDQDGWYQRSNADQPAEQRVWVGTILGDNISYNVLPGADQIGPDTTDLPFTNLMEFQYGTRPDSNDTDGDSIVYRETLNGLEVTSYQRDWLYSDGLEVFKFGSNPASNDSDYDLLPDWYEYRLGWNESTDSFVSVLQVHVVWVDVATGNPCADNSNKCASLAIDGLDYIRPTLTNVEFQLDPSQAEDAQHDPDKDGDYICNGVTCQYIANTNLMEFYGITDNQTNITKSTLIDSNNYLKWDHDQNLTTPAINVTEWWHLRGYLLHLDAGNESTYNYFKIHKLNENDPYYAYILDDNDPNFFTVDPSNDAALPELAGNQTDEWGKVANPNTDRNPEIEQNEHAYRWYLLDFDGDSVADGTNILNWDTDMDWLNDWFEIDSAIDSGSRNESVSPIRYEVR